MGPFKFCSKLGKKQKKKGVEAKPDSDDNDPRLHPHCFHHLCFLQHIKLSLRQMNLWIYDEANELMYKTCWKFAGDKMNQEKLAVFLFQKTLECCRISGKLQIKLHKTLLDHAKEEFFLPGVWVKTSQLLKPLPSLK